MHYIYSINAEGIKEYFPIITEAIDDIPYESKEYVKSLATLAEKYHSHIEIDASTGIVHIGEGEDLEEEAQPLSPTHQVARAVEHAFINEKYGHPIPDTIREIGNNSMYPDFDGHIYCFLYITAEEYQQSIIVLDSDGQYLSSYDELDQKFDPPVDGLDEQAISDCAKAFEVGADMYRKEINKSPDNRIVTR